MAIEKTKILGAVLEPLLVKPHCQFLPSYSPQKWAKFKVLFPLRPVPPNLLNIIKIFLDSVCLVVWGRINHTTVAVVCMKGFEGLLEPGRGALAPHIFG